MLKAEAVGAESKSGAAASRAGLEAGQEGSRVRGVQRQRRAKEGHAVQYGVGEGWGELGGRCGPPFRVQLSARTSGMEGATPMELSSSLGQASPHCPLSCEHRGVLIIHVSPSAIPFIPVQAPSEAKSGVDTPVQRDRKEKSLSCS